MTPASPAYTFLLRNSAIMEWYYIYCLKCTSPPVQHIDVHYGTTKGQYNDSLRPLWVGKRKELLSNTLQWKRGRCLGVPIWAWLATPTAQGAVNYNWLN